MSIGDIGLIFTSILTLKQLYGDVEGNKKDCRNLIARCSALEKPLQAIQADKERLSSSQEALSGLQSVLEDCVTFCKKYTGKRWLVKAYRNIHGGDKERFGELNARISACSTDLQLGVNFDSISGVSQGIHNLRHHLGDDMTEIKARMSELTNMVQGLLQCRGAEFADQTNLEMIAQTIRNSENLIIINEDSDPQETTIDEHPALPFPPTSVMSASVSSAGSSTTVSTLSVSVQLPTSAKSQLGLLPIDHSQLVWHKEPANLLGVGAFGAVYKCEYLRVPCALKHFVCLTQQSPTARELAKIRREARILQLASFHPNIIGYRGVDLDLGMLLMELAMCSLYDILYRKEKHTLLPIDGNHLQIIHTFTWKVHALVDILSALSFLHFHGVLHRDIKSANILFVFDQSRLHATGLPMVAKLSDFGLASAVGLSSSGLSVGATAGGSAVGTSVYMAPELLDFEHRPQYSEKSDVYAIGILANELLTEQVPWKGLKDIHVLHKVVNKHQRPPGYTSVDPLEQHVVTKVIGNHTTGALHQDAEARPVASSLSQYLQEYLDFLAEDKNAIKPLPEKVVPIDRPALMKQVAIALFPTISEEELMELVILDQTNEKNDDEGDRAKKVTNESAVLITQVSEAWSEEALSERLVDEFEFDLECEPHTDFKNIQSEAITPFSPYPEAPKILNTSQQRVQPEETACDDSVMSSASVRNDAGSTIRVEECRIAVSSGVLSSKGAKPIKPAKPASLKATIALTAPAESINDPVMVPDSSARLDWSTPSEPARERIVGLIATLSSSSTDRAKGSNRGTVLQELIHIVQEGHAQQTLVASLGGITAAVKLLDQCQISAQTKRRTPEEHLCFSEEWVQVTQLLAFLAKNHTSNQSEIGKQGALPILVNSLTHSEDDAVKATAASALIFLINHHTENQKILCDLHALSSVIQFVVEDQRPALLQGGSEVLRLLTDIAESQRDLSSIVAVLQYGPEPLQIRMAQLIAILAEGNKDNQNALSSTNAMQVLITHLNESSEELVEHSVRAMQSLATKHSVNREAIVSAGGIEPLMQLVIRGLGGARVTAMDLLRVICSHTPTLRLTIAKPELLNALKTIQDNKVAATFVKHSADLLYRELTQSSGFIIPSFITNFAQGRGK